MQLTMYKSFMWTLPLEKPWQDAYYPSVAKKIQSSNAIFHQLFETNIIDLTSENFKEIFQPLYERQISTRSDYRLDKESIFNRIFEHMQRDIPYKLFAVFEKQKEYAGGVIFSIWEDEVRIALRVFDREVNKRTKQKTTVDYWAESLLYQHLQTYGKMYARHGVDTFIRGEGMIGLPLFKLSIGAKPKVNEKSETWSQSLQELIDQNSPQFFFAQPNEQGYFTKAYLIHEEKLSEVMRESIRSVLEWAEIEIITLPKE